MGQTRLDQLQSLLTKDGIRKFKDDFLAEAIENLGNISSMDKSQGIVYEKNEKGDDVPYYFTESLDRTLYRIYEDTKIEIEEAFNDAEDGGQKRELMKQIKRQINVIVRPQKFVFEAYPFCKKYLGLLIMYLNEVHKCGINNPYIQLEEEYRNAPFRVKNIHDKTRKFDKLYKLLVEQDIIQSFDLTESDFYKVMSGASTNKQICFTASNAVVAHFLKSIAPLYTKFNGSLIERSKRFVTNRNNRPLTQGNYNTSKTRLNSAEDIKISEKIARGIRDIFSAL